MRFQPRGTGQLASLRTWVPLTAVVAIISFGMLVYSLVSGGGGLYKVITTASHQTQTATPTPASPVVRPLPAPPQLLPTHTH